MVKKRASKGGYVTRTQAVRYLQVSLADFRRLCILKGIYPRDLTGKTKKKVQKGSTKPITAYYRKDIQYLAHEPILNKFREHKIFARKLSRAIGRGDLDNAKRIDRNRPRYTLDHIIKERYPTFVDALGDLDDALSTLFLFAMMPANDKVTNRVTADAERLTTEWMAYIAREHLLKKVFVSIKGVYYQATVKGQDITWVVPHKFPQNVPSDIDFRIMLTFLEFYTTLTHFVLYKLYTEANLIYPPSINLKRENGVGGIGSFILQSSKSDVLSKPSKISESESNSNLNSKLNSKSNSKSNSKPGKSGKIEISKALAADKNQAEDSTNESDEESEEETNLDEFSAAAEGGDLLLQPKFGDEEHLFSGMTFFVGREVPLDLVEFVVLSQGGSVISESALDELIDNEDENVSNHAKVEVDLSKVTHQICDRPALRNAVVGRIYVQPQWLFDSVNSSKVLDHSAYAPGESLPPHLSPWGDRGVYNPEEDEEDEDVEVAEDDEEEVEDVAEDVVEAEDLADEAEAEAEAEAETKSKNKSKSQTKPKKNTQKEKPKQLKRKSDEEKELRKTMMSKKQRVLYDKIQGGIDKEEERKNTLRKKRQQLKN